MKLLILACFRVAVVLAFLFLQPLSTTAQSQIHDIDLNSVPATLTVDVRDVAAGLVRSSMSFPVRPGMLHLEFPKWIPAEDGPTGPIAQLTMLRVRANGAAVPWARDSVDLYRFNVNVPPGVGKLDVDFATIMNNPSGGYYSDDNIAVIDWNRHLLYESGVDPTKYRVHATILLPNGWGYGTALPVKDARDNRVVFDTVSLSRLVDSPLDCGRYTRHVTVGTIDGASVLLDLFADGSSDLVMSPAMLKSYQDMVRQVAAMYGSRHFDDYHSLVTVSDRLGLGGLDHHETGEEHLPADFFTSPGDHIAFADLIPHEFSHSWNGDYRTASGLDGTSFEQPVKTDLIWIREGLNSYLGDVLSYRSGMRPMTEFPEYLAAVYAELDSRPGRAYEPVSDIATGLPLLNSTWGLPYTSFTRPADLYLEGELVWFDVDTIIRSKTQGAKSLDDFLKLLAGKPDTGPVSVSYDRQDIEELLAKVVQYDWHRLFEGTIYTITAHPPSDELERAGWKVVYNGKPNSVMENGTVFLMHPVDAWYSIGLWINYDGSIQEVRPNSIAWRAGLMPFMRISSINEKAFSPTSVDATLRQASLTHSPLRISVKGENGEQKFLLQYYGGPRYPHLVRIAGRNDMLSMIVAPVVK